MPPSLHQSQSAKLGEITFRSRLVHQHLDNKQLYPNEYSSQQMLKEFLSKLDRHRADFSKLKHEHILASPFLEIGAGYGQTSLLLTNEFSMTGFATDLSPQPLLSIAKVAKKLYYPILPELVICDAEQLPFPDNSLPFIYCYQTLHHFPHPAAPLAEIYRVLRPGGYFFFGEEPVSQIFNLNLWRRPTKLRAWEKVLKYLGILHFISRIGKTEVDRGIHEETFSLADWSTSLHQFTHIYSHLQPFPIGPIGSLHKFQPVNRLLLAIMGGGISGLFQKPPGSKKSPAYLTCPNCNQHPRLTKLRCPTCHTRYPTLANTPNFLPAGLRHHA